MLWVEVWFAKPLHYPGSNTLTELNVVSLKVFRVPMSYYKHIKVHSSVKPFFCTLCNYRAVRKDNVRQHVKKVTKHWFSLFITKFILSYPSNRFTKWPCPTPWSSSGRTAITTTAMSILIRMRSSTKTNNSRDDIQ